MKNYQISPFYIGECNFECNRIQKEKFKEYLKSDSTFKNVFTNNLTIPLKQEIDRRSKKLNGEDHSVLGMTGETGSGKSNTVVNLCSYYNPSFNVDHIFWENQDILDNLGNMKKGDWVMRDESLTQFGVGSHRIQASLNMVIETLRKAGINFIFLGAVDREIPTAHYYLEVIQKDITNRVNRVAIREPKTMKYLGYAKIKVMDEDHSLWVKYNEKKDLYMKKIQNQEIFSKDPFHIKKKLLETGLDWKVFKKNEIEIYLKKYFPNRTIAEYKEMATAVKLLIKDGDL